MKVLLIIPAYNEEANILATLDTIYQYQSAHPELAFQLDYLVVNDGSRDSTEMLLRENQANHVELIMNLGIGGAVQTGYLYAQKHNYDVAVQFDGDGQHDIRSLLQLIQPILDETADFSIGSRFVEKSASEFQTTGARRTGIKILSTLIRVMCGFEIKDVTSGYRAANKKVIALFAKRYPTSYPEPESIVHLLKKGYHIVEQPVNMLERKGGQSSIRALKSVTYMLEVGAAIVAASFMKKGD